MNYCCVRGLLSLTFSSLLRFLIQSERKKKRQRVSERKKQNDVWKYETSMMTKNNRNKNGANQMIYRWMRERGERERERERESLANKVVI